MENTKNETSSLKYTTTVFGAGKPVAPFSGQSFSNQSSSLDPSSYLRADRYPIPNSFNGRLDASERDFS